MADKEEYTMDDVDQFLDGIEEYLDYDEIDDNYQDKVDSPFTQENTISIDNYVNNFLGIPLDCRNLWHSGLRELKKTFDNYLLSFIISIDNNIANANPDLVYMGYYLLVVDNHKKGNRGTYINPLKIKELFRENELRKKLEELEGVEITKENEDKIKCEYELVMYSLSEIEKIKQSIRIAKKTHKVNELIQNLT